MRNEGRENVWKQMRSAASLVESEEPEFKVDLRIEGIAQDVILKYEERMVKIHEMVDKLRTGYNTKSIIVDLEKTGNSIKFSEESRCRTTHELGNVELHELGQPRTVQCQFCLKLCVAQVWDVLHLCAS